TASEVGDQKEYRTRIVTTANKANLTLAEADELMFKKTAYAMAGFF
ncbi:MAG: complement resistance protein TraT, partial [Gammaproteobacteria bacterium]